MIFPGPSRAGPGPRVWSKRGPPALKAPKNILGHAIFLLDHALKFTGKTLLLGGHALLYTVGKTIFEGKALLISASGPAGLETFLEETENKEKIQNICLSGPLKAPGPLVTTLATPLLDGPGYLVYMLRLALENHRPPRQKEGSGWVSFPGSTEALNNKLNCSVTTFGVANVLEFENPPLLISAIFYHC